MSALASGFTLDLLVDAVLPGASTPSCGVSVPSGIGIRSRQRYCG